MTPKQFLDRLKKAEPQPLYLFLGNELFLRDRCRRALNHTVLGDSARETPNPEGLTEIDLGEQHLAALIDEARTMSLFATARLVIGTHAEAAIPRGTGSKAAEPFDALRSYAESPTPGTVVLFEATRIDLGERDDKSKIDRLVKLFGSACEIVEMKRLSADQALRESEARAEQLGLQIDRSSLSDLIEMLGGDMGRLTTELEKLSLYVGGERAVRAEDLELLIPEARRRGVFEFSEALAHGDRVRALDILGTIAETGVSWPMQVSLIAALFRQALAMEEQGARTAQQVLSVSKQYGIRMWPPRARQLVEIGRNFSRRRLEKALIRLGQADRDLRRERPNDRVIMEQLVMAL